MIKIMTDPKKRAFKVSVIKEKEIYCYTGDTKNYSWLEHLKREKKVIEEVENFFFYANFKIPKQAYGEFEDIDTAIRYVVLERSNFDLLKALSQKIVFLKENILRGYFTFAKRGTVIVIRPLDLAEFEILTIELNKRKE